MTRQELEAAIDRLCDINEGLLIKLSSVIGMLESVAQQAREMQESKATQERRH